MHAHMNALPPAWNITRGLLPSTPHPQELLDVCCKFLHRALCDHLTYVVKGADLQFKGQRKQTCLCGGIIFFFLTTFLLVPLACAADKSSLSSLDCLSSIVDRITSAERSELSLQDTASLSPVASTNSQPATPGASSSRLIYHVLWTITKKEECPTCPKRRQVVDNMCCSVVNIILPLYKKMYLTESHICNDGFSSSDLFLCLHL